MLFKSINGSFVPIFPLSNLFHSRIEMQGSCYYFDVQGSLLSTYSFVCYLIKPHLKKKSFVKGQQLIGFADHKQLLVHHCINPIILEAPHGDRKSRKRG